MPTYAAFAGTGGPVATADLDRLVSELLEAVQSESHIDGVWRRRRRLAPGVVRTLAAMSFSGPWAVHTEYGPDAVAPALERIAGEDVAYLRRIAAEPAE